MPDCWVIINQEKKFHGLDSFLTAKEKIVSASDKVVRENGYALQIQNEKYYELTAVNHQQKKKSFQTEGKFCIL